MFNVVAGRFDTPEDQNVIDDIRNWASDYFREDLAKRPSLHRYVTTLPEPIQEQIGHIRNSPVLLRHIQDHCKGCDVTPMASTDEFYVSHYNMDRGGDQGLFDKHFDGNLRFVQGMSVIRALVYVASDGSHGVVFETSGGVEHKFETYDFGLLDFHRELHWVRGSYNPDAEPRMLLKLNYLICPDCTPLYRRLTMQLNLAVFYVVKTCMEYSKSPTTPLQVVVGWLCNVMRMLNNVHPFVPFLVLGALIYLAVNRVFAIST